MPPDRYTRVMLTVIAIALVYLCVVLSPMPAVQAQHSALRPGDPTGPAEVVIVGWRLPHGGILPVQIAGTAAVQVLGDVRVTGQVTTEQRDNTSSRVVLVGWHENGSERGGVGRFQPLRTFHPNNPQTNQGLPVTQSPPAK